MKTKIPSPVLARLQLMFQSGATLSDVTAALDLDTTWQQADSVASPQTTVKDRTPVVAPGPISTPANDTRLPKLAELATKLEAHIEDLLERDEIRDVPALAGSLDAIAQHAIAIRKEISSPDVAKRQAAPAHVAKPAQKQQAPASKAPATPAQPKTPPPAMKVPAPKKADTPKAREKLKPTESLPAAAKRRAAAHPFAASLQDGNKQNKKPVQPAAVKPAKPAGTEPLMTVDQPANAFRDRIAAAMNQIATIADDRAGNEEPIAARRK